MALPILGCVIVLVDRIKIEKLPFASTDANRAVRGSVQGQDFLFRSTYAFVRLCKASMNFLFLNKTHNFICIKNNKKKTNFLF